MSGPRGPVPKRSTERRRRNKESIPQVAAVAGGRVEQPPLRDGLHPLAVSWYAALAVSGQARFYEPSDWAMAQVTAEAITAFAAEPRANMLSAILSASSSLLATEGDRRRMRLELTRAAGDPDEAAAVTALDDYRAALGAV